MVAEAAIIQQRTAPDDDAGRALDTVFEQGSPERVALRRKIAEMDRLLRRILERGNADDASVKRSASRSRRCARSTTSGAR